MPYGRLPRRVREVFTETIVPIVFPACIRTIGLGDRAAGCGGIMEIVCVWVKKSGEWAIIHRCKRCGIFHSNRFAADDDPLIPMSITVKPLASPPFPFSSLEKRGEKEETDT